MRKRTLFDAVHSNSVWSQVRPVCVCRYLFKYIIIGDTGEIYCLQQPRNHGGGRSLINSWFQHIHDQVRLQGLASHACYYSSLIKGFSLYMTSLLVLNLGPE